MSKHESVTALEWVVSQLKHDQPVSFGVYTKDLADEIADNATTNEQWNEIIDLFEDEASGVWNDLAEIFADVVRQVTEEEEE